MMNKDIVNNIWFWVVAPFVPFFVITVLCVVTVGIEYLIK